MHIKDIFIFVENDTLTDVNELGHACTLLYTVADAGFKEVENMLDSRKRKT